MLAVKQGGSRVAAAGAPGGWGVSKACRDCAGWRERLAEAQRSLSGALADAKVWRYWHGKAKERAVWWQAQYEGKCAEPTARKLAEAEREVGKQGRRIADLERQVELLEQEKAGVEQRNRRLAQPLRHPARPAGNLLRNPALPRHLLAGCQLAPPRPNPGPRQTRHAQPIRPAPERHLRQTSLSRLESNPQSLNPLTVSHAPLERLLSS